MAYRLDVFVSSTNSELRACREAVAKKLYTLGHYPVEETAFDPDYGLIHEKLRDRISGCDAMIHIAGLAYGGEPRNRPSDQSRRSYTQMEFHIADELNVPTYVFVTSDGFLTDQPISEPDELANLQLAHRRYLQSRDHDWREFSSCEELLDLVSRIRFPRPPGDHPTQDVQNETRFKAVSQYISGHDFVGRDRELAELNAWAVDTNPSMVIEAIGGAGKSLLAWTWAERAANAAEFEFAGAFWYSLYERGADLTEFLRAALSYFGDRAGKRLDGRTSDLVDRLLEYLRARKWLLCLDGMERLLTAYQRIDYTQARDDQILSERLYRGCSNQEDETSLRRLCCERHKSKVLITTRLFPTALENNSHEPLPGLRVISLQGLEPSDAERLLRAMGVTGRSPDIQHYMSAVLGCHPLVVGVVGGLVVNYLKRPSDFDAWAADEDGGAAIRLSAMDLTQRRNHVLKSSIDALPPNSRRLLYRLSLLIGAVDYQTARALSETDGRPATGPDRLFEINVNDLRRRGLLQWDRRLNEFDLHPVVRGYAVDSMSDRDLNEMGRQNVDYFSARAPRSMERARTFDQLKDAIQVVMTLIRLRYHWRALEALNGQLAAAMLWNAELHHQFVDLARLFIASDPPVGDGTINNYQEGYADLYSDYSIALRSIGRTEEAIHTSECAIMHFWDNGSRPHIAHNWLIPWSAYAASVSPREISGLWKTLAQEDHELNRPPVFRHLRTILVNAVEHNAWSLAERVFRKLRALQPKQDPLRPVWELYYYVKTQQIKSARSAWAAVRRAASAAQSLPRSVYRGGIDLLLYCELLALETKLELKHIDAALDAAQKGANPSAVRALTQTRGELFAMNEDWKAAAEEWRKLRALTVHAKLDTCTIDARSATARFHLGNIADSSAAAGELNPARAPRLDVLMAELLFLHGRREAAEKRLRRAYDEAAAEGWPYSDRAALAACHRVAGLMGLPRAEPPPFSEDRLRYRLRICEQIL
jgi:hypothetical protein